MQSERGRDREGATPLYSAGGGGGRFSRVERFRSRGGSREVAQHRQATDRLFIALQVVAQCRGGSTTEGSGERYASGSDDSRRWLNSTRVAAVRFISRTKVRGWLTEGGTTLYSRKYGRLVVQVTHGRWLNSDYPLLNLFSPQDERLAYGRWLNTEAPQVVPVQSRKCSATERLGEWQASSSGSSTQDSRKYVYFSPQRWWLIVKVARPLKPQMIGWLSVQKWGRLTGGGSALLASRNKVFFLNPQVVRSTSKAQSSGKLAAQEQEGRLKGGGRLNTGFPKQGFSHPEHPK